MNPYRGMFSLVVIKLIIFFYNFHNLIILWVIKYYVPVILKREESHLLIFLNINMLFFFIKRKSCAIKRWEKRKLQNDVSLYNDIRFCWHEFGFGLSTTFENKIK